MRFLKSLFVGRKNRRSSPASADDLVVGVGQCPHCNRSIKFEIPRALMEAKNVLHSFPCPKCGETIHFMDQTMYK